MKMRLFWLPCLMFLFGTFCASCGSDDNEPTDEPGAGGTEVNGDYTATTAVKTAVLKYNLKWSSAEIPVYYEDFNRKYGLYLSRGCLGVLSFIRQSGVWNSTFPSYNAFEVQSYNGLYVMIEDVGKVNSLPEVIKKLILPDDNRYYVKDFPVAQPNHGYAVAFKTENDEVKYLRILITDYTLDHNGTVAALTVQYQLY